MRFLGYTLANEADMPTEPPRSRAVRGDGHVRRGGGEAGVIVATGGIAPTAEGAKVTLKDGEFTVVDGPFTEAKELVGGWALMECRDMDEADRVDQALPQRARRGRRSASAPSCEPSDPSSRAGG